MAEKVVPTAGRAAKYFSPTSNACCAGVRPISFKEIAWAESESSRESRLWYLGLSMIRFMTASTTCSSRDGASSIGAVSKVLMA